MSVIKFIVYQVLSNETLFLGIIALIGLLFQRKNLSETVKGVVHTIVGFAILMAGVNILINSLSPVIMKLNATWHVHGVLPTNDAAFGIVMHFNQIANDVILTFILAFIIHLLLVKITPGKLFKNVYLMAQMMLYLAAFLNVTIPTVLHTNNWETVIIGAVLSALYLTYSPAITRYLARHWMHDTTLGFMDQVGAIIAHYVGKWCGSRDPQQDADNMRLPKWANMFKDDTVMLFFVMPLIFIGIGLAVGPHGIQQLMGHTATNNNWIIWLILQGINFTAGIVILMYGVNMFIAAIVPAFKGISEKLLPGAIPALGAPTIFPYSPMGGMFGFLGSSIGCILVTILTITCHAPVIVFPSPIIMYFDGMVMGIFGNKAGGWRGALAAGFVTGMISSAAVILFYPLTGKMFGSGLTWSNIDYAVVWMPILYLLKGIRMLILHI